MKDNDSYCNYEIDFLWNNISFFKKMSWNNSETDYNRLNNQSNNSNPSKLNQYECQRKTRVTENKNTQVKPFELKR